jgi:cell division protein FtsA
LGVALIDLGAGTTSVSVFEENNLLHTAIIPIGGMHVTNDIAIGLRCAIDTAEKVKLLFGHSNPKEIPKTEDIDLASLDDQEQERVSRLEVVEIIEARIEEILEHITRELKKISRDGKLPAGIVLSGGGSKLPGLQELVKKQLRLPVQMGTLQNLNSVIDQVADPSFAVANGLILWGNKFNSGGRASKFQFPGLGLLENQNVLKLRKWFKSFLP